MPEQRETERVVTEDYPGDGSEFESAERSVDEALLLAESVHALAHGDSVRSEIRTFLRTLFVQLQQPLPAAWPDVPAAEFAAYFSLLRKRIDLIYQEIDRLPQVRRVQKQTARFFPESALQLLRLDWQAHAEWTGMASARAMKQFEGRPQAIVAFDQLYCTPDSTERRVHRILQSHQHESQRVLFLGDDDLGSVVLALDFVGEIHVIDLDTRLLEFIASRAPSIQTHRCDLIGRGIPREFCEYFDVVVLDPPWEYPNTWAFLNKAICCLKSSQYARIYLSFCPLQLELDRDLAASWNRLARWGLTCESISPCFQLYRLSNIDTPEYGASLDEYLPPMDSPILRVLRQTPFAFAHLYELRRIVGARVPKWRKSLFRWWHSSLSSRL